MLLRAAVVALVAMVARTAGDCPPRQRGDWEHSDRPNIMAGYNKELARCHDVQIILLPLSIHMDKDLSVSNLRAEIYLEWEDPYLPEATSRVVLNASEVWVPDIISVGLADRHLSPTSAVGVLETVQGTRHVRLYHEALLRGWCSSYMVEAWPRDQVHCAFLVQPSDGQHFNLSHHITVAETVQLHVELLDKLPFERLPSWEVLTLDSQQFTPSSVMVEVVLRRLPGQLEAEVVHPILAVSALVPASVALPPRSGERPTLLAIAFMLHAVFLLSLPRLVDSLEGDATPRALVMYRDFGLLLLLVAVQWLLALRLASRTRPLPAWAQSLTRCLAALKTPLLLTTVPSAAVLLSGKVPDEQSAELSEIFDRLTFLAVLACYLGLVIVGLQ